MHSAGSGPAAQSPHHCLGPARARRERLGSGRHCYNDTYVRDIEDLVGHLGLRRFDLLGHSVGGIAAYVYAVTYPECMRRLVIEDAGPGAS